MTLLELYEKLCTGEIKMINYDGEDTGLCWAIYHKISIDMNQEFHYVFRQIESIYLPEMGKMTELRQTILLLFAAYKGEL